MPPTPGTAAHTSAAPANAEQLCAHGRPQGAPCFLCRLQMEREQHAAAVDHDRTLKTAQVAHVDTLAALMHAHDLAVVQIADVKIIRRDSERRRGEQEGERHG